MRFPAHSLRLAAILAFTGLAACGGGSSRPHGSGYASLTWQLEDVAGYRLNCDEVGAAAVVVTLTDLDTGTAYTQPAVACSAFAMSTGTVPAGSYSLGFDLYGDPQLYGNTSTVLDSFDIVDANGNLAVFHILNGGNDFTANYAQFIVRSLFVDWGFTSGTAASTCAVLGVRYVELDFTTSASPTTAVTTRFDCNLGQGLSLPYPYGPSSVTWQLYLVNATGVRGDFVAGSTALPALNVDPMDQDLGTVIFQY